MSIPLEAVGGILAAANPLAQRIESDVRRAVISGGCTHILDDASLFSRYYRYYTVPLLEGLDVMKETRLEDARFWGTVQVCLGLHLRYTDYLLDCDKPVLNNPQIASRSAAHLYLAQRMLAERGFKWGPDQWVQYRQYFDFEGEVFDGYVHGPMSLWRRVSPLTVVGSTYCRSELGPEFIECYHRFLGWCLLEGDYHDWLKDLKENRRTNVTSLMLQGGEEHPTEGRIKNVLTHFRNVLCARHRDLVNSIGAMRRYPLWRSVVQSIGMVNVSEE